MNQRVRTRETELLIESYRDRIRGADQNLQLGGTDLDNFEESPIPNGVGKIQPEEPYRVELFG